MLNFLERLINPISAKKLKGESKGSPFFLTICGIKRNWKNEQFPISCFLIESKPFQFYKMSIQFREPKSKNELEAIFYLRQKVYSEDSLLNKMVSSNSEFDINEYDLNAFHFAAFIKNTPIAYIRITSPVPNNTTKWTQELIIEHELEIKPQLFTYPFEKYYPDKEWIHNFLQSISDDISGEVGKLVIHKNYREGGKILNSLISNFHTFCFTEKKYDMGFGSCSLKLERYYQKFGFKRAENSIPFTFQYLPEAVIMQFKKT